MDCILIIDQVLQFILSLYGDLALPRKVVDDTIDFLNNFIRSTYTPTLKNDIQAILKNKSISDFTLKDIEKCFDKYSVIFENVNTEAKRFQLLRRKGFIDFEEFKIGTTFVQKLVNNEMVFVPDDILGVRIPLQKSLKLFLEIPGLFHQIEEYIAKLNRESSITTNIIQANL